jgi:hypothetical protein
MSEHTDCGTETCCGTCEPETEISLTDASLEQVREAAIDLMTNILGIQQDMFQHVEILGIVSQQLDEMGCTAEDLEDMTAEALRRFGVPESLIAEAAADTQLLNVPVEQAL